MLTAVLWTVFFIKKILYLTTVVVIIVLVISGIFFIVIFIMIAKNQLSQSANLDNVEYFLLFCLIRKSSIHRHSLWKHYKRHITPAPVYGGVFFLFYFIVVYILLCLCSISLIGVVLFLNACIYMPIKLPVINTTLKLSSISYFYYYYYYYYY